MLGYGSTTLPVMDQRDPVAWSGTWFKSAPTTERPETTQSPSTSNDYGPTAPTHVTPQVFLGRDEFEVWAIVEFLFQRHPYCSAEKRCYFLQDNPLCYTRSSTVG